jgi:hypothetical protein
LFSFGKRRADEADRASASQREEIQNRIDKTHGNLREKLAALERILRQRSSRRQ